MTRSQTGSAPTISTARIEGPLDALTAELDRRGYPQSAQRICTRLFLAEFGTSGPLSQSTIAEKTNLNVATVRDQLGALTADGYVDRHSNPQDPRENLYCLRSLDLP